MRRVLLAVTAAAVVGLLAAADKGGSDLERLQGRWVMVSLDIGGEPAPDDLVDSARLTVEGNTYTPKYNNEFVPEQIKLDPEANPRAVDFKYTGGPRKGEVVKGIYKLEGDLYTMCRPILAEHDRPTEFSTKGDSGLVLVVWTRDNDAQRARRAAVKGDRDKLNGVWAGEFNRRDGKTVPDDEAKAVRLIITGDRYTLLRGGDRASRGINKIDPTASPKRMDINIIDGVNKGQTWLGIYEVDGDVYRGCFSTDGKTRPTAFSSEPGSGHVLWRFRREHESP